MPCIWVLVAESSRAKLYSAENRPASLVEIGDFVHPESRLHEGELVAEQSGSDGGRGGMFWITKPMPGTQRKPGLPKLWRTDLRQHEMKKPLTGWC